MKKYYALTGMITAALLLNTSDGKICAQTTTFENHYGTTYDQSAKDVYQTADGGYLMAATTENATLDDLDLILVKTDAAGTIQSIKPYGGSQVEYPNDMCPTDDGNFFVLGYSRSFGGGDMDIYLLKVDQDGDVIWTKNYGGWGNEEGKEIIPTADGNYVIVGATNSASADNQMELIKIDPAGTVIWTKYYGTPAYESARSVKACADGGFIIAGKTSPDGMTGARAMLVRTNSAGDTLWTRIITDGVDSYESKSIVVNSDGTFTLAIDDSSATNDSDVRLMKLADSPTGAPIWNRMFGGNLKDIVKNVRATTDGGYILGCISRSFGWSNPDMWIIKVDGTGTEQWSTHFGGFGHEHLYSIRQTTDGGYIAAGHARSFAPEWEMYLIKLDAAGTVGIEGHEYNQQTIVAYPNPSDGVFNLSLPALSGNYSVTVSNALGQVVYFNKQDLNSAMDKLSINMQGKEAGLYYLTLSGEQGTMISKLMIR